MNVALLVLDGVFDTGLAAIHDTLEVANLLAGPRPPFRISRIGVRARVRTGRGLAVPTVTARRRPDLVIVPSLGVLSPEGITARVGRPDARDACALLTGWSRAGTQIAGACCASFLFAEAGLLDERRATTTWWLAPTFRQRYPRVELDDSSMIADAQHVITAGAALAHLDLALYLIRRISPTLARTTARHLVYDTRPSQAAFIMPDFVAHADPVVERFEAWARSHLADFSIAAAARAVGIGERTLERRLRRVLGKSPVAFVRGLRVQYAVHRLETTADSVETIAESVGYRDAVTLRTLLRTTLGRGVRELRAAR